MIARSAYHYLRGWLGHFSLTSSRRCQILDARHDVLTARDALEVGQTLFRQARSLAYLTLRVKRGDCQ